MNIELLIDSKDFWDILQEDIRKAKKHLYVQMMTFEGDTIGKEVAKSICNSKARDKKVLIDRYSDIVISDKFVYSPSNRFNPEFNKEIKATKSMFQDLSKNGVLLKRTNDVGFLLSKFAQRNHKKMVVIDDEIAYIGGFNFSDHNFSWHDMMMRIHGGDFVKKLREDFLNTWMGGSIFIETKEGENDLFLFDGKTNTAHINKIIAFIKNATKSIFIYSPYITKPFMLSLIEAKKRGVSVTLITPDKNNSTTIKDYLQWECERHGITILFYPERMLHLKAILIDDTYLIAGSSNFDYLSYYLHEEIIAVFKDKYIIENFKKNVLEPDLEVSHKPHKKINAIKGYWQNIKLHTFFSLLQFLQLLLSKQSR